MEGAEIEYKAESDRRCPLALFVTEWCSCYYKCYFLFFYVHSFNEDEGGLH
jgi:hypothetical protein